MLGNGRVEALCFDGETRIAQIRGRLRKKVYFGFLFFQNRENDCGIGAGAWRDIMEGES